MEPYLNSQHMSMSALAENDDTSFNGVIGCSFSQLSSRRPSLTPRGMDGLDVKPFVTRSANIGDSLRILDSSRAVSISSNGERRIMQPGKDFEVSSIGDGFSINSSLCLDDQILKKCHSRVTEFDEPKYSIPSPRPNESVSTQNLAQPSRSLLLENFSVPKESDGSEYPKITNSNLFDYHVTQAPQSDGHQLPRFASHHSKVMTQMQNLAQPNMSLLQENLTLPKASDRSEYAKKTNSNLFDCHLRQAHQSDGHQVPRFASQHSKVLTQTQNLAQPNISLLQENLTLPNESDRSEYAKKTNSNLFDCHLRQAHQSDGQQLPGFASQHSKVMTQTQNLAQPHISLLQENLTLPNESDHSEYPKITNSKLFDCHLRQAHQHSNLLTQTQNLAQPNISLLQENLTLPKESDLCEYPKITKGKIFDCYLRQENLTNSKVNFSLPKVSDLCEYPKIKNSKLFDWHLPDGQQLPRFRYVCSNVATQTEFENDMEPYMTFDNEFLSESFPQQTRLLQVLGRTPQPFDVNECLDDEPNTIGKTLAEIPTYVMEAGLMLLEYIKSIFWRT